MSDKTTHRNWPLIVAGALGASAVALGAYAAHGLEAKLLSAELEPEEAARRVRNFETGARYQLHAALAMLGISLFSRGSRAAQVAAWAFGVGALIFCGLLYALAFVGPEFRWLGAVVPLGGLLMIAAWVALLIAGWSWSPKPEEALPAEGGAPTNDDLVRVEELLTHQQRLLQELDEVVTSVRSEADLAGPRVGEIERTLRRLVELQEGAEDLPDERPPHY